MHKKCTRQSSTPGGQLNVVGSLKSSRIFNLDSTTLIGSR